MSTSAPEIFSNQDIAAQPRIICRRPVHELARQREFADLFGAHHALQANPLGNPASNRPSPGSLCVSEGRGSTGSPEQLLRHGRETRGERPAIITHVNSRAAERRGRQWTTSVQHRLFQLWVQLPSYRPREKAPFHTAARHHCLRREVRPRGRARGHDALWRTSLC
jgi:hypothetical protein